jgi:hypothetical protein
MEYRFPIQATYWAVVSIAPTQASSLLAKIKYGPGLLAAKRSMV